MPALNYSIEIDATPKQVWQHLLSDAGYRDWTAPFCAGSYFEGSWDEGAGIRFMTPEGHGMVARIAANRQYEHVSIRHLGIIKDGVPDFSGDWVNAFENYTLVPIQSGTRVEVALTKMPDDFVPFMDRTWPLALQRLKQRCEQLQPLTPFLWFNDNAEAAVNYYLTVFPDASISKVLRYGKAGPGPEGSVMTMAFQLRGLQFTALNGGPHYSFSGAISFVIHCDTQAEVDHYWDKLGTGGKLHQCGWLTDRFGMTWQVVPRQLVELLDTPDAALAQRVTQAMMQMVKLDIAMLEAAARAAG